MGNFPRKADGRRIFTVEFNRGVVQQTLKGEKTLAEVSREPDIQPTVITRLSGPAVSGGGACRPAPACTRRARTRGPCRRAHRCS